MRVAVLDLGSNSTRLLIADVTDGRIDEVERTTRITRLAQGVDATGRLADEAIARVNVVLGEYRDAIARHGGAERTIAIATSAVRDAVNGPEFRAQVKERFGFDLRILSGDQEATLTFTGATAGRPPGGDPTLVIDIGGGSTELVIGVPGEEPTFHVSTQAGAVRQTERFIKSDPPKAKELTALAEEVRAILTGGVSEDLRRATTSGIAVAGTATSVAAVEQKLDPYDPERVHGYELQRASVERILSELAGVTELERREVPGLQPDRAPTICAGIVILIEALRAFGLDSVETSEADILHGAALSAE